MISGGNIAHSVTYTIALLAGGLATRLRPITEKIPKAMVEVAGKPFIEHQVNLLKRHGLTKWVICAGYLGEQIEDFLGDGSRFGISVQYSYDGAKLLGTGGALRKAAGLLDRRLLVLYGDSYLDIDYQAVIRHFESATAQALMTVFRNSNRWDTSNVIFEDGMVKKYSKRQKLPEMQYIDYGLGILHQEVLQRIPEGQPYDLADLYENLSLEGVLTGYEVKQRFYEIGSPAGLEELSRYLAK